MADAINLTLFNPKKGNMFTPQKTAGCKTSLASRWLFTLIPMLAVLSAMAQPAAGGFDDHQNMMDQLGVKKLRPGADPKNQTTFDEAIANPYTNSLPDLMTLKNGAKVTRPEQWLARRSEIQEDFE